MSLCGTPHAAGALGLCSALLCFGCCGQGPTQRDSRADAGTGGGAGQDASLPEPPAGHDADPGDLPDGGTPVAATDAGPAPPPLDLVPPELVFATPADGDDNVASDTRPALVFSEPVVLGPGALTLTHTRPARALAFTATVSTDRVSVELAVAEPLDLPADLALELGAGITDLAGNSLAPVVLRFTVPVWLRLGTAQNRAPSATASDVLLAIDGQQRPVLLATEGGDVYASRFENGAFEALGPALNRSATLPSAGAEPQLALAIDASGSPMAAFRQVDGVMAVSWDGTSWRTPAAALDQEGGGSYAPALALEASGQPIVAFDALDGSAQPVLRLRTLSGSSWQTLESLAVQSSGVRLAGDGLSDPTLAYQQTGARIMALRWNGAALVPLGSPLPAVGRRFALSVSGTQAAALSAEAAGTSLLDAGRWSPVGEDLGFENSSAAFDRALAHAPDATLLAAFTETPIGEAAARVYAQRFDGVRFAPLGPALNRSRQAAAARPALAVDASGVPVVAWLETPANGGQPQIFVSRFNGDPARPPFGLRERSHHAACLATVPADGSPLTNTDCFADALGRRPVSAFVPFDVRSPLWSDGAFKRRFFMLPEGGSIQYRDPGTWTFPDGTIVIKEFSIEGRRGDPSTLRPVETRFLVVRDGREWERYSFEWSQDADQALLRSAVPALATVDFAIQDELGAPAVQTHFYPTRAQCLSCHEAPGTLLGAQTAMLNRNFDYGTTVDNELRSLQQLGLFAGSFDADALAGARSMPSPADASYSTEARLRAALHANCSGCHHPLQSLDLRIQIATLDSGLCTKLTKGSLDGSILYWRDVLRGYPPNQPGVAPMPPVGTLVPNPLLERLLTDWILDPKNPCP